MGCGIALPTLLENHGITDHSMRIPGSENGGIIGIVPYNAIEFGDYIPLYIDLTYGYIW